MRLRPGVWEGGGSQVFKACLEGTPGITANLPLSRDEASLEEITKGALGHSILHPARVICQRGRQLQGFSLSPKAGARRTMKEQERASRRGCAHLSLWADAVAGEAVLPLGEPQVGDQKSVVSGEGFGQEVPV